MKILLTGGGTGGHVYPLFAIAEEINRIAEEEKLLKLKIYFASDALYDKDELEKEFITFVPITAGKMRVRPSLRSIWDVTKMFFGVLKGVITVFRIYPDVVVSKGGYVSFPVLFAARIFRIPVIIHESDTVPGRVNIWAGKFAKKIALSFEEASSYFDPKKVSVTGQPVRRSIMQSPKDISYQYFELDKDLPTIGIFAGSQGAKVINEAVLQILPSLIDKYQIIHQTGPKNIEEVKSDVSVILGDDTRRTRYKPYGFLGDVETKMLGGASSIIIGRSGSSLFEIAAWGKPSILIPYAIAHGDHQRKNAYHYARTGACTVIEEANLTPSVLLNEIENILNNQERYSVMAKRAKDFFKPDAANQIAIEAIKICLSHENK